MANPPSLFGFGTGRKPRGVTGEIILHHTIYSTVSTSLIIDLSFSKPFVRDYGITD